MIRWRTNHAFPSTIFSLYLDDFVIKVMHEIFIVSHLKVDAILGMPFLEEHQCRMDIQNSALVMAGKELVCVDKFCRPLLGRVQVVQGCTELRRFQATLHCKGNCKKIAKLGLVEGMPERIQLANSLNRPMHQPFHRADQVTGWRPSGEIPLHPGSRCRASTGNSGRHPRSSPLRWTDSGARARG